MNVNKKPFIISGLIAIGLIAIILILMVVLESRKEKRAIQFSMENQNETNNIDDENVIDEKIDNKTQKDNKDKKNIDGEITYSDTSDGGKIPVPPEFNYIGGDISSGAIIQDNDGNEFVWIPVNDINSYQRQIFINNGENVTTAGLEELNIRDINSYNIEFNDSILNYGGFYVARYEAGKEEDVDVPVSKKGVMPWTQVVWEKARNLSMAMYQENDFYQTDLINSYAWDTICNWIRSSGTSIDDSVEYGNYQNSIDGLNRVAETGSNERWKINNIYDMAGNVWEYTTEEYGQHEKYHIGRGGGYWNDGNLYPISTRGESEDGSDFNIGFRVVMYLK